MWVVFSVLVCFSESSIFRDSTRGHTIALFIIYFSFLKKGKNHQEIGPEECPSTRLRDPRSFAAICCLCGAASKGEGHHERQEGRRQRQQGHHKGWTRAATRSTAKMRIARRPWPPWIWMSFPMRYWSSSSPTCRPTATWSTAAWCASDGVPLWRVGNQYWRS